MKISFDHLTDASALYQVSKNLGKTGVPKAGNVGSDSFADLLKKMSDPAPGQDTGPIASMTAQEAQALSRTMVMQINETLLDILSDSEKDQSSPESAYMNGLENLLLRQAGNGGNLSRIRQIPSETGQFQAGKTLPAASDFSQNIQPPQKNEEDGTVEQAGRTVSRDFEEFIQKAAGAFGMDSDLIRRVIQAESSFDPNAVSAKGAMGLMQLMPATARELGVNDPMDPAENIMGGTRYLKMLLDRYEGSEPLALAAYNWGMGNLDSRRHQMPDETKNYVAKITGITLS